MNGAEQPSAAVRAYHGIIGPRDKCRAWLASAPRTTRQIADLLSITPQHAASIVWQLRRLGQVEVVGALRRGHENRYRLR